jgi:hypothetical protein
VIFKLLWFFSTRFLFIGLIVLAGSAASASTSFQFTYLGTTYDVTSLTGTGYNGYFADAEYLTAAGTGGYFMPWFVSGTQPTDSEIKTAVSVAEAFATAGYNSGLTAFSSDVNGIFGAAAFIIAETDPYHFVSWNGSVATLTEYSSYPSLVYAVATEVPIPVPEINGSLMPQALALVGGYFLLFRRRRSCE